MKPAIPEILTIDETAARRGVSRSRVIQYIADGRLKPLRAKPPIIFDAREVDAMEVWTGRGRRPKAAVK